MPRLSPVATRMAATTVRELDSRHDFIDESTYIHRIKVSRLLDSSSANESNKEEDTNVNILSISVAGITFSTVILSMMVKFLWQSERR